MLLDVRAMIQLKVREFRYVTYCWGLVILVYLSCESSFILATNVSDSSLLKTEPAELLTNFCWNTYVNYSCSFYPLEDKVLYYPN